MALNELYQVSYLQRVHLPPPAPNEPHLLHQAPLAPLRLLPANYHYRRRRQRLVGEFHLICCADAEIVRIALLAIAAVPEVMLPSSLIPHPSSLIRHLGYEIEVPNPFAKIPAFVKLFIRGWLLLMTADNAAAVEMLGCFKKSCGPQTVAPCRACLCTQVS